MSLLCLAILLFFATVIALTGLVRTTAQTLSIDRVEKTSDAVLSVSALLIPASLGLASWLHEKLSTGSYTIGLAAAILLFFVVLAFTIYVRFNVLLGQTSSFVVDFHSTPAQNRPLGYWFTTVMSGITLGLALLAISIATSWSTPLRPSDSGPPIKVTCVVTNPSPPITVPPEQVSSHKHSLHARKETKK